MQRVVLKEKMAFEKPYSNETHSSFEFQRAAEFNRNCQTTRKKKGNELK